MQDFVIFLYSTMSRTIMEIFSEVGGGTAGTTAAKRHKAAQLPPHLTFPPPPPQAGSAEDWGSGVALPESVLKRATLTFENLSHVVRGDQEVRVAWLYGRPGSVLLFPNDRSLAHWMPA